jgi:hypothetical protein
MKKSILAMSVVFCLFLMSTAGDIRAQERQIGRKIPSKLLTPDLIVSDMVLIKDCWIKVTIKNIGTGGVPAAIYNGNQCGLQMYNGSQPHGGMVLRVFDPKGLLKTPGASVSNVWFQGSPGLNLSPGVHSMRLEVDTDNAVAESNETNNSLTKRLSCKGALPDLIVSNMEMVTGTQAAGCLLRVTLKNIGTAGVPDTAYAGSGSTIQLYYGANPHSLMTLAQFDPSGLLKTPGASVSKIWVAGAAAPADLVLGSGITHPLKVNADANNAVAEAMENNNSQTKSLTCTQP